MRMLEDGNKCTLSLPFITPAAPGASELENVMAAADEPGCWRSL